MPQKFLKVSALSVTLCFHSKGSKLQQTPQCDRAHPFVCEWLSRPSHWSHHQTCHSKKKKKKQPVTTQLNAPPQRTLAACSRAVKAAPKVSENTEEPSHKSEQEMKQRVAKTMKNVNDRMVQKIPVFSEHKCLRVES